MIGAPKTKDIFGEMLSELIPYDWNVIGTLTTKNSLKKGTLEKRLLKWVRRLENLNQKRVNYVFNIEQVEFGKPHVHFVLGNISDELTIKEMRSHWKSGHSKITLYDSSLGGLSYTLKEFPRSQFGGIRIRGLSKRNKISTSRVTEHQMLFV